MGWWIWGLAVVAWLAALATLRRGPKDWPADPVAWWSGDRAIFRPIRPMRTEPLGGARIAAVENDPTLRVEASAGDTSSFGLGRWLDESWRWSWAFWFRARTETASDALRHLTLASVSGPLVTLRVAMAPPGFEVSLQGPEGVPNAVRIAMDDVAPGPGAPWHHVTVCVDRFRLRLHVDGRLRGELPIDDALRFRGAEIRFLASVPSTSPMPRAWVDFDDVVTYDRALADGEAGALARVPRGRLPALMNRPALAQAAWQWGWPVLVLGLAVVWALSILARLPSAAWILRDLLPNPAYRSAWLVLASGGLATTVFTVGLAREARREDEARFAKALHEFRESIDTYFERIADLLARMRDWVAAQPELEPDAWRHWSQASHVPHDFSGLLGIGFAEQVRTGDRTLHEQAWSKRYGFPYRIWPDVPSESGVGPRPGLGEPLLPVVLYQPSFLEPSLWRSNQTILGRNLLALRQGDPRVKSEAVRLREAMAEGSMASSGLEEIAPAGWYGDAVHGLRLYSPLRSNPAPVSKGVTDPEARIGVAFASIDLHRWIEERSGTAPLIGFHMYTGESHHDRHQRILDSGEMFPATRWRPDATCVGELEVPLYQYRLWLDCWSTPAFEALSRRRWSWIVTCAGGGFTLLASGLLFLQVRAREREGGMLRQLRDANAELSRAAHERSRLSRDLHDGTIQSLYAIGLHLKHAQRHQGSAPDKAANSIDEGRRLVQDTIVELREFLLSLRGQSHGSQSFARIASGMLDRLRRSTTVGFDLVTEEASDELPSHVVVQLIHVVREAVSNALRHGQPRRVRVELRRRPGEGDAPSAASQAEAAPGFRLLVADDGQGFVPAESPADGFGLLTMRERAAELGGTLRLESTPGSGTTVILDFPEVTPPP